MNALERIGVIFWKEVNDNLRDRRSVMSAFTGSLIGPAMLLLLVVILGKSLFSSQQDQQFKLPIVGQEHAPALVHYLEQNGVDVQPAPADPELAVRNGENEIILVIPEGYGEDFEAGRPATVRMVLDSSRQSALPAIDRARTLVESYNQQLAALRLMARGVSPVVIQPLAVERVDVATPQTQALIFLNMMPYFIVMVVFMGGMYVIIDATSGERERGSLEPLLINPAARWEFVMGKLAASLPFAIGALFLTLAAFVLAFNFFPVEDYIGFQLTLSLPALTGIFFVALPMVLLASSLQMIIATFTRSFKEAQTYVSFLPLIPALPGLGLAFLPVKPGLWHMLIPTFGQQLIINQLMRGEPVNGVYVAVSTLATLALATALILVAIRLYQRERILFGAR